MDKFLLCSNPMNPKSDGTTAIVHTLFPVMLISAKAGFHEDKHRTCYQYVFADQSGQDQEWTLIVHTSRDLASGEQERQVMERCWRWFRSYLEEKRKESLLQFVKSNL